MTRQPLEHNLSAVLWCPHCVLHLLADGVNHSNQPESLHRIEQKPSYIVPLGDTTPPTVVQWFVLCGLGKRHRALISARAKRGSRGPLLPFGLLDDIFVGGEK